MLQFVGARMCMGMQSGNGVGDFWLIASGPWVGHGALYKFKVDLFYGAIPNNAI